MVRAGIRPGLAPGFRANVLPGGKLRFVSDLQLPAHSPAKCNSRRPPSSPFASAAHGMPHGTGARAERPRSRTGYRPDAHRKGCLPGKRSLERASAGKGRGRCRRPALYRKPGNPCTKQSGTERADQIGSIQEPTPASSQSVVRMSGRRCNCSRSAGIAAPDDPGDEAAACIEIGKLPRSPERRHIPDLPPAMPARQAAAPGQIPGILPAEIAEAGSDRACA